MNAGLWWESPTKSAHYELCVTANLLDIQPTLKNFANVSGTFPKSHALIWAGQLARKLDSNKA